VVIGVMTAPEWPWVLGRSRETGWAQMLPAQRAQTSPEAFAGLVQAMLGQTLSAPGGSVLVAREDGLPVGYLVIGVVPDELSLAATGLFMDIYIEPAWRGRQVSSMLTAAGEAHCRGLGLSHVRRVVAAHNTQSLRHAMADGCQVERFMLIKQL
jgi:ribosomal protein S18 acetylase RimI-like enzyme